MKKKRERKGERWKRKGGFGGGGGGGAERNKYKEMGGRGKSGTCVCDIVYIVTLLDSKC